MIKCRYTNTKFSAT